MQQYSTCFPDEGVIGLCSVQRVWCQVCPLVYCRHFQETSRLHRCFSLLLLLFLLPRHRPRYEPDTGSSHRCRQPIHAGRVGMRHSIRSRREGDTLRIRRHPFLPCVPRLSSLNLRTLTPPTATCTPTTTTPCLPLPLPFPRSPRLFDHPTTFAQHFLDAVQRHAEEILSRVTVLGYQMQPTGFGR